MFLPLDTPPKSLYLLHSMPTKRCPKCPKPLPTSQFGSNRSTSDGLSVYCRVHQAEIQKEWKQRNPAKVQRWKKRYDQGKKAKRMGIMPEKKALKAAFDTIFE